MSYAAGKDSIADDLEQNGFIEINGKRHEIHTLDIVYKKEYKQNESM